MPQDVLSRDNGRSPKRTEKVLLPLDAQIVSSNVISMNLLAFCGKGATFRR